MRNIQIYEEDLHKVLLDSGLVKINEDERLSDLYGFFVEHHPTNNGRSYFIQVEKK